MAAKKKASQQAEAKRRAKRAAKKQAIAEHAAGIPRCGLCGKTSNLTRTECCGQWICDDEHEYRLFSYARNSCHRNHGRYTLCAHHFVEGHAGRWQDCDKCREDFQPEMYVYYGTNEYNFEVLENPPEFEPTHCADCGKEIDLSEGGYSHTSEGILCQRCCVRRHPELKRLGYL